MTINRICLDLDGVLCDFVLPTVRLFTDDPQAVLNRWPVGRDRDDDGKYVIFDLLGVKERKFWDVVGKAGCNHWAGLPAYEWHKDLYGACVAICPTIILTTPSRNVNSVRGKACWIQKHFGCGFSSFLIGPPKEFCASPGALLIDDSDLNCDRFRAAGGEAIVFPQPWNSRHAEFPDGARLVIEELQQLANASALAVA